MRMMQSSTYINIVFGYNIRLRRFNDWILELLFQLYVQKYILFYSEY